MAFAGDDAERRVGVADANAFLGIVGDTVCGVVFGVIGNVEDGRVDDADNGLAVFDEGDVDGEFAVSFDEFFGAVKRVDEPERVPVLAFRVWCLFGFFGEEGNVGCVFVQGARDNGVCGEVGVGEGGLVVFLLDGVWFGVDVENGVAGFACEGDEECFPVHSCRERMVAFKGCAGRWMRNLFKPCSYG